MPGRRGEQAPADAREQLVEQLASRIDRGSTAAALRAVPRHRFVPDEQAGAAYRDTPLPIGGGQTISAPHMVAEMTDQLALDSGDRVLEVGTGCGYHAAVTAEVVGAENVFSIEYDSDLATAARERLEETGYGAVSVRAGDGHRGWPERAPFDAAYLTCAAPRFPEPLVSQVREGGRLLAPLGSGAQRLVLARRDGDRLVREFLGAVRFVPMLGRVTEPSR